MRIERRISAALLCAALIPTETGAAPPTLTVQISGPAEVVFDTSKNPCPAFAMPDIAPRAFRDAQGQTVMFALEQANRPLVGASLSAVQPTCRSALPSGEDSDPAAYDGRQYITAAWTSDGRNVAALVHNEYHAENHPGRCASKDGLACWYNTVLSVASRDGGRSFAPTTPLIVAAPPFRQEVGQTRHRGFFNPSNMFAGPDGVYAFASTTGWDGQPYGACLLRNRDPLDPAGWRGWDGKAFAARWSDPYTQAKIAASRCEPLKPFGYPVASVVRHRASGRYLAIWEQPKTEGETPFGSFPIAGFYFATSSDSLHWSEPALLLPTANIMQPCGSRGENKDGLAHAYPALLDERATGRNYDNVGDTAWLYLTRIKMEGCVPGAQRVLSRHKVSIRPAN